MVIVYYSMCNAKSEAILRLGTGVLPHHFKKFRVQKYKLLIIKTMNRKVIFYRNNKNR
jgi:hypothetical protein